MPHLPKYIALRQMPHRKTQIDQGAFRIPVLIHHSEFVLSGDRGARKCRKRPTKGQRPTHGWRDGWVVSPKVRVAEDFTFRMTATPISLMENFICRPSRYWGRNGASATITIDLEGADAIPPNKLTSGAKVFISCKSIFLRLRVSPL